MDELTAEEARVVGSLAEKQLTTPQYYPLTFNALVNACNQSNNRNPVVSYAPETVETALDGLRRKGYARIIHAGGGSRVPKYRQTLDETLGLDQRELALLTVLLLRGPQTIGELRGRTERMAEFDGLDAVDHDLDRLAARETPLVVRLERAPGQKEGRVATTLTAVPAGAGAEPPAAGPAAAAGSRRVVFAAPPNPFIPTPREPRLAPAQRDALDDEARELLDRITGGTGQAGNLFATLVHHPRLLRRWSSFGGVLLNGTVPARERELVILRVGWLCRAAYEFGQHVLIARRVGVTDEEIDRIRHGGPAGEAGWNDRDLTLVQLVDELHTGYGVTDGTWAALERDWEPQQLLELLFTVGQYHLVAMVANAVGIQPEEGVPPLDAE
ncbi:MAG TPA: DUF480 domain-containing protein [Acidimicrobiales bacterium]|nr:DUF480 domain-containing protein [Acidimicrobiales bacterium]